MSLTIRRAETADAAKCGAILYAAFQKVADQHNFPPDFPSVEAATDVDRGAELREAVNAQTAIVVEHLGGITGFATGLGFFAHAVAETNQDLKSLIGAAPEFQGPGFLLPTRNHEVFAWCLDNRLKLVMQMTLMSIGLYNEPAGAWLPSILF